MSATRYTVNPTIHIASVDDDSVAVVSSRKRFCIKGVGMARAVQHVLEHFHIPQSLDDIVAVLSGRYSNASLYKLLSFLICFVKVVSDKIFNTFRSIFGEFYKKSGNKHIS